MNNIVIGPPEKYNIILRTLRHVIYMIHVYGKRTAGESFKCFNI